MYRQNFWRVHICDDWHRAFLSNMYMYTQSQKKCTMNSLASLATQGHGQVTPAGSYLIIQIWNRSQRIQSKNVKWFSRYLYSNIWICRENRKQYWNEVFGTLLSRALLKWSMLQSSSIYSIPQQKCNFPRCVSFEIECICFPRLDDWSPHTNSNGALVLFPVSSVCECNAFLRYHWRFNCTCFKQLILLCTFIVIWMTFVVML